MKFKLRKSSFEPTDMMIMFGVGVALGGLMGGIGGVVIGVLIIAGAWAITKFEKTGVEPDAK